MIESSRAFGRDLVRGIMRYSRLHGPWVFPWVFYRQDLFYVAREAAKPYFNQCHTRTIRKSLRFHKVDFHRITSKKFSYRRYSSLKHGII